MTRKKYAWIALVILIACMPLMMGAYNDVIGIYNVIRGGTGCQTLTDHGVMLGSGTSAVTVTDSGADGEVLVSNGAAADPDWEYIPRQNLLENTQWRIISNADTARGYATMNYDAGSTAAPTAGLAITGGTSGATAKLISVTTATGTWAGNNATGVMTLGACAGCFHDNETASFTGGTAVVNMPNSATGVGKIQNGSFSVDTDPPPGWTASGSTLTTDAGGQVGNMMTVTSSGDALGKAYQDVTTVVGKTYYFNGCFKKGTSDTGKFMIGTTAVEAALWDSGALSDAGFTAKSQYVTATATTTRITCQTTDATTGETSLFDELSFYEVAPGCTAADTYGFNLWQKTSTLDLYQDIDNAKAGSFYCAKSVPSAQNDNYYYPQYGIYDSYSWINLLKGRTITFGAWVKSSTANDTMLRIRDASASYSNSSYHTGGGSYEWLEVTRTISSSPSYIVFYIWHASATPGIAYISQPMLTFGSSIGSGNYAPEANRWVYLEKGITSQAFHGKTGANGFSDVTNGSITITSDTGGLIGWGCNSFEIAMSCNDVASAGTACFMSIGPVASTTRVHDFWVQPYGLPNDGVRYGYGRVTCGATGTYSYTIDATGSNTFDIPTFRYTAVEWR